MTTTRCVVGFGTLPWQQCLHQMGPQDRFPVVNQAYYSSYSMGPLLVRFSPLELGFFLIFLCWCSDICLLLAGCDVFTVYTNGGLNHLGLHCHISLRHTHGRHINSYSSVIDALWWHIQLWGSAGSPDPSALHTWWRGFCFPCLVPHDETFNT